MDPLLQRELERLTNDNVAFRAFVGHRHHTWARTYSSQPELYIQPESHDEIHKVVTLARRCRKRITIVGSAHSPSDLTCTSSWMVNLDRYSKIVSVDESRKVVVLQSGIRLGQLGLELRKLGLAMPNLGSIDDQSIAGAIATATHGSTLRQGILSQSVLALRIMLSNGNTVLCSPEQNGDLFSAALVSLGALGIITEITFQAVPLFNIEWEQSIQPLSHILDTWSGDLWTQAEWVRVWWCPYGKKGIVWKADKTVKPLGEKKVGSWYGGWAGFHTYQALLYVARWVPRLLPGIEWFVFGMQYGFGYGACGSAVEEGREGFLTNCLFSQFVNEWALPLSKGPEAISRLQAWIDGDQPTSRIPFSPRGIYIHSPIEVRVSGNSFHTPKPHIDPSHPTEPTLYLNATLYRPYNRNPPCLDRYYQAFEYLMKDLGGRPHWAKNFTTVTRDEIWAMYPRMGEWVGLRDEVDPVGMFVGSWHRRFILPPQDSGEESRRESKHRVRTQSAGAAKSSNGGDGVEELASTTSEESFDLMHGAEAEGSLYIQGIVGDHEDEHDENGGE
ncbi:MAG: D-arabinono-1,4-lactone oxidase [Geoglossum umbratile]|nr:MAG: D-arabinono-1,4-lactone oxidase [Geoglossum umbratile]